MPSHPTFEGDPPTPYPEVNRLLEQLLQGVQAVMGAHLIGMYLDGSLAAGDFDPESDIDFVVVADEPVSDAQFAALQSLHDRLARLDTPWAIQLEGFYLSRLQAARYEPDAGRVPNIERGRGERLKWVPLDRGWEVHRTILRERGIPLAGPAPRTLVEPVTPGRLRQAMGFILSEWAAPLLSDPAQLQHYGYQAYTVLSCCRILYTLERGEVASKRAAARWAQQALGAPWAGLIERAWEGRQHPGQPASPEEIEATLAFIRYTVERFKEPKHLNPNSPT